MAPCVTYKEVKLVEVIWDIPTNFAILASLLHHSMEEDQHIHQATEDRVWACSQGLMGDFRVCGSHVQLEAIGRLRHYLHTVLKCMWTHCCNCSVPAKYSWSKHQSEQVIWSHIQLSRLIFPVHSHLFEDFIQMNVNIFKSGKGMICFGNKWNYGEIVCIFCFFFQQIMWNNFFVVLIKI